MTKRKPDDPAQSERFLRTAEDLGIQDEREPFMRALGTIAPAPKAIAPTLTKGARSPTIKGRAKKSGSAD